MEKHCRVNAKLKYESVVQYRKLVGCSIFPTQPYDEYSYCPIHHPNNQKDYNELARCVDRLLDERDQPHMAYGVFPNFDMFRFALKPIVFEKCEFTGALNGENTVTNRPWRFDGCVFHDKVSFSLSRFNRFLAMDDCTFFGPVGFSECHFLGQAHFERNKFEKEVNFRDATFYEAAWFSNSQFVRRPDFLGAIFDIVEFGRCSFELGISLDSILIKRQCDFMSSEFAGDSNLNGAEVDGNLFFNFSTFKPKSKLRFHASQLKGTVSFNRAEIEGVIDFDGSAGKRMRKQVIQTVPAGDLFIGSEASLSFKGSRFHSGGRVLLDTLRVEPAWLAFADPREFDLTNVVWKLHDHTQITPRNQAALLKEVGPSHAAELLIRVCRRITTNYEESGHQEMASMFRSLGLHADRYRRRERWRQWLQEFYVVLQEEIGCKEFLKRLPVFIRSILSQVRKIPIPNPLNFFYRILSKYGESPLRAALCLVLIIVIGSFLFGMTMGLESTDAILYTFETMLFQKPEPSPTGWGKAVRIALIILTPIQFALLTLAIRRQFIRGEK